MTSEMLMAIAATITSFGILIGAVIAIYRIARRIDSALGVDSQGRTLSDRMDRVEHQLWENGGSSLADRVNNIEKHVVKVSTEIEFIKDLTIGLHQASSTTPLPAVEPLIKKTTRRKAS
jgi:biopolymer transport protein ExbB/TolQ